MRGFLAILAGTVAFLFVAFYYVMFELEHAFLFQPTVCRSYKSSLADLDMDQVSLPSGAVIWCDRRLCRSKTEPLERGTILFLHGNSGNLDLFQAALQKIKEAGYNVAAVDYRGYGMATPGGTCASQAYMKQDVLEAWQYICSRCMCSATPLIVVGHSLGGALAVELTHSLLYEQQHEQVRVPDQIVLLQTFSGLRDLVEDWIGETTASLLPLQSEWPLKAYIEEIYIKDHKHRPRLLIVQCLDDDVVSYRHSQRLAALFSTGDPRLVFVTLPSGVTEPHRNAVLAYFDRWSPYVLSRAS